ncbi:hypothetical protein SAMN04488012_1045 [Palleronia salina]|uniref:PAS fold-containing protein n=1 Tax=Palleronia salina TaxID=313368 RepID=A0A1M6FM47_9RHOB|nr:PAS domain-containing protein [Palleronia salina]SHI98791.1 hypothetical protein SAMN04488012_1045 [Palleronia salina]
MFTSDIPEVLSSLLDAFQVPMFVADCEVDDDANPVYRLIAINDCHARASQMDKTEVADRRIDELLSPEDARHVIAKYHDCVRSGQPSEYQETLTLNGSETQWYTTLIPAVSDAGRKRVIGNAVLLKTEDGARIFEDITYFSMQSQFQLSRMSTYLDALDHRAGPIGRVDLEILAALCRTVNRTLEDIRSLSEPQVAAVGDASQGYLIAISANDVANTPSPADAANSPQDPVRKSLEQISSLLRPGA